MLYISIKTYKYVNINKNHTYMYKDKFTIESAAKTNSKIKFCCSNFFLYLKTQNFCYPFFYRQQKKYLKYLKKLDLNKRL